MSAAILTALLRDPAEIAERCDRPEGLRELALTSVGCLAIGAAVFGGVLGSFRGGPQIAFSAIKLPAALFATLVVCVPAFHSLAVGFGGRRSFSSVAALTLAASARAALVLLACAPVLWLAVDRGLGYHASVLTAVLMYLTSGLAALGIILRGLEGSWRALVTALTCGIVFFGVLGQTAWMLRPFFGRPSQEDVPFVRAREGTFADSVFTSSKSAMGIYGRSRALSENAQEDWEERAAREGSSATRGRQRATPPAAPATHEPAGEFLPESSALPPTSDTKPAPAAAAGDSNLEPAVPGTPGADLERRGATP
ncbi:MAG: hypothetical protein KC766_05660 [Myxococcales bacterium]|nr:hypothetical protein [Myxococcales bacterium]